MKSDIMTCCMHEGGILICPYYQEAGSVADVAYAAHDGVCSWNVSLIPIPWNVYAVGFLFFFTVVTGTGCCHDQKCSF